MDSVVLHDLNFQGIQLPIQNLTEILDNTFVNLLPQVSTEYLKQWYFMGYLLWNVEIPYDLGGDLYDIMVEDWGPN